MIQNSLLLPSQKIIDALSPIVAPSTLNIIGTDGIIIASSDKERIGSFHAGAFKAAQTKEEVRIYPEEVPNYKGSKMGINTPIIKANQVIGVVGIYGHPDEIKTISSLLAIISEHFVEQSKAIESSQRQITIREELVSIIDSDNRDRVDEICPLIKKLNVNIKTPISLVLIANKNTSDIFDTTTRLTKSKLLKPSSDLLLNIDNDYLILKSQVKDLDNYLDAILDREKDLGLEIINVSAGINFNSIDEIYSSYKIAHNFKNCIYRQRKYNSMNQDQLMMLFFNTNSIEPQLSTTYISHLIQKLNDMHSSWVYPTIEAYLEEDGRIQGMSEKLIIHKNSCIYRLNKILKILDLENCKTFTIAYFLGMILQSQKSKDF